MRRIADYDFLALVLAEELTFLRAVVLVLLTTLGLLFSVAVFAVLTLLVLVLAGVFLAGFGGALGASALLNGFLLAVLDLLTLLILLTVALGAAVLLVLVLERVFLGSAVVLLSILLVLLFRVVRLLGV